MLLRWITSLCTVVAAATLQCKEDAGAPVDWWVAVKEPHGTGYLYGDANSGGSFLRSPHSMNDTTVGALAETMRQIWATEPTPAYILWNDEPPASTGYNFSYGHTKAALALDTTAGSGFWLTHSIPLYPAGPALTPVYTGLGSNAWTYAQSAACFSLTAAAINTLAQTLQLNHPQIYDKGGPLADAPTAFQELATGKWRADAICEQAAAGSLTVFAKTPAWNADLWSACVAPAVKSDLWVESWLRGSEEGPACSGPWKTLDVESLSWGWQEPSDHSKWAVAPNATKPTLCIGDINRMTTQYARAGGAVCWETSLATAFTAAVTATNSC
jgi:deoxyribonuclease II